MKRFAGICQIPRGLSYVRCGCWADWLFPFSFNYTDSISHKIDKFWFGVNWDIWEEIITSQGISILNNIHFCTENGHNNLLQYNFQIPYTIHSIVGFWELNAPFPISLISKAKGEQQIPSISRLTVLTLVHPMKVNWGNEIGKMYTWVMQNRSLNTRKYRAQSPCIYIYEIEIDR